MRGLYVEAGDPVVAEVARDGDERQDAEGDAKGGGGRCVRLCGQGLGDALEHWASSVSYGALAGVLGARAQGAGLRRVFGAEA